MQGYRTFVEPGRVAFINYGEDYGKVVVIVDIADASRVLVDGENFPRTIMPVRRLSLTKLKLDINRGIRTGGLLKKINNLNLDIEAIEESNKNMLLSEQNA